MAQSSAASWPARAAARYLAAHPALQPPGHARHAWQHRQAAARTRRRTGADYQRRARRLRTRQTRLPAAPRTVRTVSARRAHRPRRSHRIRTARQDQTVPARADRRKSALLRAGAVALLALAAALLAAVPAHAAPTPTPSCSDVFPSAGVPYEQCATTPAAATTPTSTSTSDPCELLIGTLKTACEDETGSASTSTSAAPAAAASPSTTEPDYFGPTTQAPLPNDPCELLIGTLKIACEREEQAPPAALTAPVSAWFAWEHWIGILAGVMGFSSCGIMMALGRRSRSHAAAEGATGLIWVLGGLTAISMASFVILTATGAVI